METIETTETNESIQPQPKIPFIHKIMYFFYYLSNISLWKSFYYSRKLKGKVLVGKNTMIMIGPEANVKLNGSLKVGVNFTTDIRTTFEIFENAEVEFDGDVEIMKGCRVFVRSNGKLYMGDKSYLNERSQITCCDSIHIGKECAIAWGVNIMDTDFHQIYEKGEAKPISKPIVIEDHVWIGLNSTILKGVTIGTGSIIAASSTVSKSVEPHCLYGGNPCKKIREEISWDL